MNLTGSSFHVIIETAELDFALLTPRLILEAALALLAFFMEGLTLVTLIGTLVLLGVFGFLFVVERKMNQKKK